MVKCRSIRIFFLREIPACPSNMSPQYKLYYFDFHGGAGEPIRNAFRVSGTPFEDARIPMAEWGAVKADKKFVFSQMPILEINGVPYAQSMALLRYVGKLTGLYPTDPIEALRVDEILDCMLDVRGKLSTTYSLPLEERLTARKKLQKDFIENLYSRIEKRISNQNFHGFVVGEKLTIADLALANDAASIMSGRLDGIDQHMLDGFKAVHTVIENVNKALHK